MLSKENRKVVERKVNLQNEENIIEDAGDLDKCNVN